MGLYNLFSGEVKKKRNVMLCSVISRAPVFSHMITEGLLTAAHYIFVVANPSLTLCLKRRSMRACIGTKSVIISTRGG